MWLFMDRSAIPIWVGLGILIWAAVVVFGIRRARRSTAEERNEQVGFRLGSAPWSEPHVLKLLEANPRNQGLLDHYTRLAIERRDWPEALRRARLFGKRLPRAHTAIELELWALREMGEEEAARKLLERARRRAPKAFWLQLAWAEDPQRRQDQEESARRFAWLRSRFPQEPRAYQDSARLLVRMPGRHDEAHAIIAQALERLPDSWRLWETAADLLEQDGEHEAALEWWQRMRERFPEEPTGYVRGAQTLAKLGRTDEAIRMIEQARGFFPADKKAAGVAAEMLAAQPNGSA